MHLVKGLNQENKIKKDSWLVSKKIDVIRDLKDQFHNNELFEHFLDKAKVNKMKGKSLKEVKVI